MTHMTDKEKHEQWEQALNKMEQEGLLNLTLAQLTVIAGAMCTVELERESNGGTFPARRSGSSWPLSALKAGASFWARRLMAAHSALQFLTEKTDCASTWPVRTHLKNFTSGALTITEAYSAMCVLILLNDLIEEQEGA